MRPVAPEARLETRSKGVAHRSQEDPLPDAGSGHYPDGQALLFLVGAEGEALEAMVAIS